ncbi:MAG: hypothetical protein WBN61_01410 [Woeseiaceae bacterium]
MKATRLLIALMGFSLAGHAPAELPEGYWDLERAQQILDVTRRLELSPDLGHLSSAERRALDELLAAGRILNDLYEEQLHAQSLSARAALRDIHARSPDAQSAALLDLYYLSKGPILTTLDNVREPFLPVAAPGPGKNVYPDGLTLDEFDAFVRAQPAAAASLLAPRTVVRRASAKQVAADLARLDEYAAVDALSPGLRSMLESLPTDNNYLYAIPYALAYAPQLAEVRRHLDAAADQLTTETPDFAAYLRLRSRELLSSDYEAGNAAWVSGTFGNLNAQLGSYETYDDALRGVKAFYSASIVVRDIEKSRSLESAVAGLQAIEDSLPYDTHRKVRTNIPVGAYNIVADFGQARGTNTATILPNDPDHTRKYGRTILVRNNILSNPELFAARAQLFAAAIAPDFSSHLSIDGGFERTLWHEIGHYLGVATTADGRSLGAALGPYSDLLEELKSDLVSLFAVPALRAIGYHSEESMRSHYADGIRRTLQSVRPRAEQPYQNMQLMQFNFFMEYGLIEPDAESGLLKIHYERYHATVAELLEQVLQVQYSGDQQLAAEFISRWNYWDDLLHGRYAEKIRAAQKYRRSIVRYAVLQGN